MNLKTYQAYSMAEALAAVKRDLGADAVILNTRSYKRGGVLGLGRRTVIELTATAGASLAGGRGTKPAPVPRVRSSRAATRAYASEKTPAAAAAGGDDLARTRRLAETMLAEHQSRLESAAAAPRPAATAAARSAAIPVPAPAAVLAAAPPASRPVTASAVRGAAPPAAATRSRATAPAADTAGLPVAKRFLLTSTDQPPVVTLPGSNGADRAIAQGGLSIPATAATTAIPAIPASTASTATATVSGPSADDVGTVTTGRRRSGPVAILEEKPAPTRDEPGSGADAAMMRDELSAIRQMVGQVLQRQAPRGAAPAPSTPQKLFDMYLRMIGQDVSEELADRIINEVRDGLSGPMLEDEEAVREAVCRSLADYIPTSEDAVPPRSPDCRPLTIALIGPTGVGKTTTLAKLAASFKLRHRRKVGMITADTYRIAAVDQLRTYANIIGLPLQVVLTPGEMRQAVHALSDCDVILIDTAGRSQNDTGRLAELKKFIAAAEPHEVHLVLSSTAGEKVLLREGEAFSEVGVDKVVLTKLDEAVNFGTLINVVRQIGKELSFFTTGQEVPDHIEVGRSDRLAKLVLGGEVHP